MLLLRQGKVLTRVQSIRLRAAGEKLSSASQCYWEGLAWDVTYIITFHQCRSSYRSYAKRTLYTGPCRRKLLAPRE